MAYVRNSLTNLPVTSGNIYFVGGNSTLYPHASDGNAGTDYNKPLATLDAAVARCTANNGDIIVVMPGHAEATVTSSIALDVAGVWVLGLGWGSSRPTFTMTGTGGTITMSANGCRLSNVRLVPGVASCVAAITMTGTDLIVEDCETVVHATSEFLSLIIAGSATTGSDRSIIRNNRLHSLHTTGANNGLLLSGCDDLAIIGNDIQGHFAAAAAVDNTSAASVDECLRITIANNIINNMSSTAGDLTVSMDANATGMMCNNLMSGGLALDSNVVPGNVRCVENYLADADDVHGVVVPTTAAT